MDFNTRLKDEIEFADIRYKELSEKSGVPERALYNYVATKNPSMPPADVAVKIADALGLTVEYLVTGKDTELQNMKIDYERIHKYAALFDKLELLTERQMKLIQIMISEFTDWNHKDN